MARYRRDAKDRIEAVEARRRALGVTLDAFCHDAGMSRWRWQDAKRTGLAFERTIAAAERTVAGIERAARHAASAFPEDDA